MTQGQVLLIFFASFGLLIIAGCVWACLCCRCVRENVRHSMVNLRESMRKPSGDAPPASGAIQVGSPLHLDCPQVTTITSVKQKGAANYQVGSPDVHVQVMVRPGGPAVEPGRKAAD